MPFIGNKPTSVPLSADDLEDNIITSAKIVDGAIVTADIADANVTAAKLASGTVQNQSAFKNIIINGDMSIAQRGTSFTGLGDTDSQYTLDRFKWSEEGNSGTAEFTITQSTDVPTGQGFATSLKLDCTTADTSIDSGNIIYIEQRVEGQNLQYLKYGTSSAESTTLSFWVKSNKTGTYTVNALGDLGGSGKLYSQAYTISSADTWEKKTLTFIGDTALAINNNSSNGLQLMWNLLAGTSKSSGSLQTWGSNTQANRAVGQVNLADSTSNELYITGIQWEAGTTASDFEFLPFDVQLNRCKRYFEKSVQYSTAPANDAQNPTYGGSSSWIAFNSSNIRTPTIYFECEKRATPSIVILAGDPAMNDGNMGWYNGSAWQNGGSTINKITPKGFYGAHSSNSTFTQFGGYLLAINWTADSEL